GWRLALTAYAVRSRRLLVSSCRPLTANRFPRQGGKATCPPVKCELRQHIGGSSLVLMSALLYSPTSSTAETRPCGPLTGSPRLSLWLSPDSSPGPRLRTS